MSEQKDSGDGEMKRVGTHVDDDGYTTITCTSNWGESVTQMNPEHVKSYATSCIVWSFCIGLMFSCTLDCIDDGDKYLGVLALICLIVAIVMGCISVFKLFAEINEYYKEAKGARYQRD